MIFRKLNSNDYSNEYFNLLGQLTEVDSDKITYNNFLEFINQLNDNHQIIVIEDDNKIIASGTLLIENKIIHGISKVGHIEDIVVDKNIRGLGLGKKIINYLTELANKNNCYKVILNCKESNCGFYEKCGFEKKELEMVKYF
jgi:glucosamine-phosphate N-acetyltransferase